MKELSKIKLQNRFSPITTWRDSRAQAGLRESGDNILPYAMDKAKSLNKKMARANSQLHLKGELSVKGNANDPQIVGHYSSASYEYLRSSFHSYIENSGYGVDICDNKDESGLVVHTKITVHNEENTDVYYTINFYHTTNTILVNHTGAKKRNIDMFMEVHQEIMSEIPVQKTNELNDFIKSACQEALQELREGSVNADHCRSQCSPKLSSQQLNTNHSHSNARHYATPVCHTSPRIVDVDHFEIGDQSPNIDKIVKDACKDAIMELDEHASLNKNKRPAMVNCTEDDDILDEKHAKKSFHNMAGCSHWSTNMEVDHNIPRSTTVQSTSNNLLKQDKGIRDTISNLHSPTRMSTIEAIQHQLLSALERINNLERKVQDITRENYSLKNDLAQIKKQPATITQTGKSGVKTFAQLAQEMSVPNLKPKRIIAFQPHKNIVVSVEKDGAIIVNDDDIRKVIGGLDNDITIERISRNRHNCFKKFCVQLGEERMVDTIINKWSPTIFGNSSVRRPTKQSTGKTIGVIKGVPISIGETEIVHDLEQGGFGKTTAIRISKARKPTRSIKVSFSSPEILQKAISDRVRSNNLTFVVEEYSQTSVTRCYKCHKYKHIAVSCPNEKACFNCGEDYHGEECVKDPHCVNCKGQHRPSSTDCPVFIRLHNSSSTSSH